MRIRNSAFGTFLSGRKEDFTNTLIKKFYFQEGEDKRVCKLKPLVPEMSEEDVRKAVEPLVSVISVADPCYQCCGSGMFFPDPRPAPKEEGGNIFCPTIFSAY
jgi:hypothetical protein